MKKLHPLLLSLTSGILLWLSWPVNGFALLLLIAFVPLLIIENHFTENKNKYGFFAIFKYAYLSFFIWNLLSTWWIYNSSFFGAVMAIVFNSLFMAIVFWLFHLSRRNIYNGKFANRNYGYLALISYWIAFEYLHLDWDLTWSWLNLGNGFSEYYRLIQWYEYTGTLGGTFWILLCNVMIFISLKGFRNRNKQFKPFVLNSIMTAALVLLPLVFSIILYYTYKEENNPVEIVVIQPNIDPYNEKFSGTTEQQTEKMINLAKQKTTLQTKFIVAPETALPEGTYVNSLNSVGSVDKIRQLLNDFPNTNMVIGATTYQLYNNQDESVTAKKYGSTDMYYDIYNTAILIDTSKNIQIYHKSKLVPGVEKMPFPQLLGFLEDFAVDLGGMVGSHGIQKERTPLITNDSISIASVICYESIYGEFVNGFIKNGAQFIFIITNDGWWDDTPGHRQHNSYARLRAIETRRCIARSANTGISSFLNQRGDMLQQTTWWQPDVIVQNLNANNKISFYVKYGDYFGRFLSFIAVLILLFTIVTIIINKRKI